MSVLMRVAILLAVVIAGYALLRFLARKSLYHPWRYPQGYWDVQKEIGAEDVWLTTRDGTRLHAWYIHRPDTQLATLHLHGNAGNITLRGDVAQQIVAAGSSVLLLDYRGFGKSDGVPEESGLYEDAAAGYQWLVQRGYQPGQIVLHGESLGTAVAVQLAAARECAAVVLEAPFSSAADVASRILPVIGRFLISGLDSLSLIKRVKAPILFIHGDRDEIIAFELGRKLYDAAPEPKEFWELRGASHNDIHHTAGAEFAARLAAFYKKAATFARPAYQYGGRVY
jgi:fermentation-respiration switch protein FrsA (DUF1100 family)